jgi:hypothetical protein
MLQTAECPPVKRKAIGKRPRNNVSRVTAGTKLFIGADARSAWGRRFRDLLHLHCEDLGGIDRLSEFQLSLVRRVATLEVELERMEAELAEGKTVDIDVYARVASHLRRIVETLGLQRVSRDVTPTLADIVREHQAAEKPAQSPKPSEAGESLSRVQPTSPLDSDASIEPEAAE